ncbi:MAG: tetratricopeptide repeat protein [Acidobacteria bacterium]|nr:tetratricopeptide repeat protein [Acidobacteriota bacterium]
MASTVRPVGASLRCVLAVVGLLSVGTAAAAQTSEAYYQFLMAQRLEGLGDQAGALAALNRAAAADPKSSGVRAEIASFHLRRNQLGEAESAAQQALALNGDSVEAHRVLGLLYWNQVDAMNARTPKAQFDTTVRNAIAHLERATKGATPGADLQVDFALGRLYLRTGEASKAVEAFGRVVSQNSGSVQGRLSLAQAFAAAGDMANAISTLTVIVEEEPRVASSLAQYQEQAGRLTDAIASYTLALSVEPMSRGLKFRRIAALITNGDVARAATLAAEAQTQHPDDLRFPRLRARAMFASGDKAGAVSMLEPTARANPNDVDTQLALADLYSDAGRDVEAERTLRQVLTVAPGSAEVLNYLGYLLADRGRGLDEAVRLVQRALEVDPGNPSYLDSLGWAHFRRGDLQEAERYLTPAAEQLPRNAVIQDHLGDVFARMGRWSDAIASWTRALDGEGGVTRAVIEKKIEDARSKIPR